MNFKKWRHIFLIGVAVVLAAPTAFAASSLSFGTLAGPNGSSLTSAQIKSNNLLEGFWSDVSASKPVYGDTTVNPLKIASSVSTFNISPASLISDVPPSSKYMAYQNTTGYYFWRFNDDAAPGATAYVRIWSDTSHNYYMYDSFANGAKADSPHTTSISAGAWYKAAKPDMPLITQFDEVTTTVVATGAKSGSLKVTSAAAAATDGQRQINSYSWQMGTDPASLTTVSGATSPVLSLDETTLTVGTTYYFRVIYTNWFGSTPSAVQPHTVAGTGGGNGGGGGIEPVTYTLTSTGLGLNVVSIDFDTTKGAIYSSDGSTIVVDPTLGQVLDIKTLIKEINRQAGKSIVKTVGYYDNVAKKQMGLSTVVVDANLAPTTASTPVGDTVATILAHQIQEPLQIGVSTDLKTFTLNGTK